MWSSFIRWFQCNRRRTKANCHVIQWRVDQNPAIVRILVQITGLRFPWIRHCLGLLISSETVIRYRIVRIHTNSADKHCLVHGMPSVSISVLFYRHAILFSYFSSFPPSLRRFLSHFTQHRKQSLGDFDKWNETAESCQCWITSSEWLTHCLGRLTRFESFRFQWQFHRSRYRVFLRQIPVILISHPALWFDTLAIVDRLYIFFESVIWSFTKFLSVSFLNRLPFDICENSNGFHQLKFRSLKESISFPTPWTSARPFCISWSSKRPHHQLNLIHLWHFQVTLVSFRQSESSGWVGMLC